MHAAILPRRRRPPAVLALALALATVGLADPCLTAGGLRAQPFTAIQAYGDSLTDTWREPSDDPILHYQGRWSNGPLWIEFLSPLLGFPYEPAKNYAHSGAQCDDTFAQVTNSIVAGPLDTTLFVVWAGGNDFLQEYDTLLFDDDAWTSQIRKSVSSLSNAVVSLFSRSARHILVPNTVDITRTPAVNAYLADLPFADLIRSYFRGKVVQFNTELGDALDALSLQYPDRSLLQCDAFAAMDDVLNRAAPYGFTETELDALADTTLPDKRFDGPGAHYVFWDSIHPTSRAHELVADWFQAIVAPRRPALHLAPSGPDALQLQSNNLHAGKVYTLETSTNLISWSLLYQFTHYPATNPVQNLLTAPSPAAFYRLRHD